MLSTAILLSVLAGILSLEMMNGQFGFGRPLMAATLVGLLLGDVTMGVTVGVTLQLIFMGVSGVGAAVPPDQTVGTVIATAFAILTGQGAEIALSLAVPVAVAAQAMDIFGRTVTTGLIHYADRCAEKSEYKKLTIAHYSGALITFARTAIVVFPAIYLGVDAVQDFMAVIPVSILRGLEVSGGLLPVVGFGMLFKMLDIKHLIPFYFIGFAMATFGGFSIVGVTMLGACFAVLYDYFTKKKAVKDVDTLDELDRLMQ